MVEICCSNHKRSVVYEEENICVYFLPFLLFGRGNWAGMGNHLDTFHDIFFDGFNK